MKHMTARKPRDKKKLFLIPFVVGALFAGGVAFAAWTSSGSGTGSAQSTTSIDSLVSTVAVSRTSHDGSGQEG